MTPALEVRDLGCTLDGRPILDAVAFSASLGELVGVIGPNGAGKSTLLHALAGLLPSTGSVLVSGRPLRSLSTAHRARLMALMPQTSPWSFPFPAWDVVMMGRHPYHRSFQAETADDRRAVEEALALTGTTELSRQPVTRMSGGERQRVLFARTLAQETGILLLDEPTSSLDLSFQDRMFSVARDRAHGGRLVLAAVHDLRLAARFCHRLVLMARGRILAEGFPEDVLTSGSLREAYGVPIEVYRNPVTGSLDCYVSKMP